MKVTLLCGRVGKQGTRKAGDIVDLPPAEAQALIDAKQATAYKESPEAMTVSPPENAMRPPAKGRRSKPYIDSNHSETP